jgi:hypothetical protein
MASAARYLANFIAQSNNILDASVALVDLGPDVLANIIIAGSELANITTSNIAEGNNLYFTNTRAIQALTAGDNITIEANGMIVGEPGYVDENAYANSQIWFANVTTSNITEGVNLYYTDERAYANAILIGYASNLYVDERLAAKANVADLNTSNVAEGSNLYFTNARARAAISVTGTGSYDEANGIINIVGGVESVNGETGNVVLNTSNIAEGSNLYYTDERAYANTIQIGYASNTYLEGRLDTKANVADLTTANVTEDTNLYFTNTRAIQALTAGDNITIEANGLVIGQPGYVDENAYANSQVWFSNVTTSNIAEGSNLYFTNARVYANLIAGGFATESYVDSGIANLVNSAPEALDTLYELANALGNDANFATSITTLIGKSYDQANAAYDEANTKTVAADLTTANVVEVTNLYFTNARVYANVLELGYASNLYVDDRLSTKANVSDLTTANVTEDTNLYFTNTRAIGALTGGDNITIESNGLIIGQPGYVDENAYANSQVWFANVTTSNVAEGSNLYFTNDRVYANVIEIGYAANAYVNDMLATKANTADLTTANVIEDGNLYFTNDRVYANVMELGYASNLYVDDRLSTKANVADLTTSNVVEGSNLYFTNARAVGALTSSDDILINSNGLVSSNIGAFKSIVVSGMADIIANTNDTLEFVAGTGMTILTNPNASPKIIAFSANVSGVSGAAGGNLDFGSIVQPAGFTLDMGSIF